MKITTSNGGQYSETLADEYRNNAGKEIYNGDANRIEKQLNMVRKGTCYFSRNGKGMLHIYLAGGMM